MRLWGMLIGLVLIFGSCDKSGSYAPGSYSVPMKLQAGTASDSLQSDHYLFLVHHAHYQQSQLESLRDSCEKRLREIEQFVGKSVNLARIPYYIYEYVESLALEHGSMAQGHIELEPARVFSVQNRDYVDNFLELENLILLRDLLGPASSLAIEEGLAIRFARRWQRYGYAYWLAKLVRSGFHIPLVQLLDESIYSKYSRLMGPCMAAGMVDFLIERRGKESFLAEYSYWPDKSSDIAQLEAHWKSWLTRLAKSTVEIPAWRKDLPAFHKGMTLAHEGYRIYNGYGSAMARQALDSLQALHVNAVSIVPYSGTRETTRPVNYRFARRAGSENDASVVHIHHAARRRGMISLMKPQIWFPGSWPGAVDMQNSKDWDRFFQYYRNWISHYAMLAEIHQMEVFSVGCEFQQATLKQPEAWAQMIRDLKQIYRGYITYSANWGTEFEGLEFGHELDFLGVNCYYPLSSKNNPSESELLSGAKDFLKKIRSVQKQFDKPVLFTEAGFRSIPQPWKHPHEEASGSAVSEKDQALCYEALIKAMEGENWVQGIYWWKWPSYMDYSQRRKQSFSPCGKEAEAMLREWYEKK